MPASILGQQALTLPVGNKAARPTGVNGMIRANNETGYIEYYDPTTSTWIGIGAYFASGGSESVSGSYKIHQYTSSGTFTVSSGAKAIEILLVAGGGSTGGQDVTGGAGAGGLIYNSSYASTQGQYTITVGGGGSGGISANNTPGNPGGNTTAFGYTAVGGGGGGGGYTSSPSVMAGLSGGSGGGGGGNNSAPGGSGTPGQGYPGGPSSGPTWGTGAGGGAGGTGPTGVSQSQVPGGSYVTYSVSGSPANYAGGGYGNNDSGSVNQTGYDYNNNYLGTYGFGACGTGAPNTNPYNGNGGIVIIRYTI
jgi:hypothetical protein